MERRSVVPITKSKGIVGLIEKISSQQVSAQDKIEVMQRALATCPRINMGCGRKVIPSLLDSGSQVTLICQSFFEQEILPHIKPADGEKAEAHHLFQLTAANNGKLPISMYVVCVTFGNIYQKYYQCLCPHVDQHLSPPTASSGSACVLDLFVSI